MIRALEFTATTHPIQLPSMTEGFGSGILINVWVRRTGTGVRQRIVDMTTAAGVHLFLGTGDQADTLTVGIEDATHRQEVVALGALPLNRWVKVMAKVFPEFGTGFATLSVFDIDLAQGQTGLPGSGAFTHSKVGAGGTGNPFVGQLSKLEISRLQASGWGSPAKPPVQWAYYPLDKVTYLQTVTTNGVDVKHYAVDDTSTNNRDGAVEGELQSLEFASLSTGTIPVLALPGEVCVVRLSPLQSFSGKMTLETWFKPTSASAQQTLLRLGDDGDVTLALCVGGNSILGGYDLVLMLYQGTMAVALGSAHSRENAGVFQHLAVTISQGGLTSNKRVPITISLYLNGQLQTTATVLTSSLTTGTGTTTDGQVYLPLYRLINAALINNVLLSGSVGASTHFTGQLSELRMWNVCRSAQEISAYFLSRAIGNEPGLLACYRMEQRVSDCIFDISASRGLGKSPDDGSKVYSSDGTLLPKDFTMGTATNLPQLHTSNPTDAHLNVQGKLVTEYLVYNTPTNATAVAGPVTVFDATLETVLADGSSLAGGTIQVCPDWDTHVYLDQPTHISMLTLWKAKTTYEVAVPASGKVRLRFRADMLWFRTLRARFSDMPEGVWTLVRPDSEMHANLASVTGAGLLSPPQGKTSPLPAGTTAESADVCATALAAIADCYRPSPNSGTFGVTRGVLKDLTKKWKKVADWTQNAVSTVGSTLQKAGTSAGQFANALVDDGTTVLSQATSTTKSAAALVCRSSIDFNDLIKAATNAVPRFGTARITEAIQSADRLAFVSHAGIGEIAPTVSIIGTSIINGVTYVWRAEAAGWANAVQAMAAFLKKIGADIQKMIQFLAWLFNWNDFLIASDGIYDTVVNAFAQMSTTIQGLSKYKETVKSALTPSSDVPTQSLVDYLGVDIPKNLAAKELDYVMELGYKLMGSADLEIGGFTNFTNDVLGKLPSIDTARLESLRNAVENVTSPSITSVTGLLNTPINQLMSEMASVTGEMLDFVFDTTATISGALVDAITALFTGRISVPHVSGWIESTILGGRELNLLRIVSLAGAIVRVLIDKIGAAANAGQAEPQAVSFSDSNSESQSRTGVLCANFALSLALVLVEALYLVMHKTWPEPQAKQPDPKRGAKFAFDALRGILVLTRSGLSMTSNEQLPMDTRVIMNIQSTFEAIAGGAQIAVGASKCLFANGKDDWFVTYILKPLDLLIQGGCGLLAFTMACLAAGKREQFPNKLAYTSFVFESLGYVCVQSSLLTGTIVEFNPKKKLGPTGDNVALGLQVGTMVFDLGAAITSYESNEVSTT